MVDRLDLEARLRALRTSDHSNNKENVIASTKTDNQDDLTQTYHDSGAISAPIPSGVFSQDFTAMTSVTRFLGKRYAEAMEYATKAVILEQRRSYRKAVRLYVKAGELVVNIGQQQTSAELQLKMKITAYTLLQRAEALSEWIQKEHNLSRYAASSNESFYGELQEKVRDEVVNFDRQLALTQLKDENELAKEKLADIARLIRARKHLKRLISARRTQKTVLREKHNQEGNNDITAQKSLVCEEESFEGNNTTVNSLMTSTIPEVTKLQLVNELHTYLGLPEVNQLRSFKPLSLDDAREKRMEQLEAELDEARRESVTLRCALEEKKILLYDILQRNGSSSDEQDDELDTITNWQEADIEYVDAYEDTDMIYQLRRALHDPNESDSIYPARDTPTVATTNTKSFQVVDSGVWL